MGQEWRREAQDEAGEKGIDQVKILQSLRLYSESCQKVLPLTLTWLGLHFYKFALFSSGKNKLVRWCSYSSTGERWWWHGQKMAMHTGRGRWDIGVDWIELYMHCVELMELSDGCGGFRKESCHGWLLSFWLGQLLRLKCYLLRWRIKNENEFWGEKLRV